MEAVAGQTARILLISLLSKGEPRILLVEEEMYGGSGKVILKLPGGRLKFGSDNNLPDALRRELDEEVKGRRPPPDENYWGSVLTDEEKAKIVLTRKYSYEPRNQVEGVEHLWNNIFPLVIDRRPEVKPNTDEDDIFDAKWVSLYSLPYEGAPNCGVPLASGIWKELHHIFSDPEMRQYFVDSGISLRQQGILLKRWKKTNPKLNRIAA